MERLFCFPSVQSVAALNSVNYMTLFMPGRFVLPQGVAGFQVNRDIMTIEDPSEFSAAMTAQMITYWSKLCCQFTFKGEKSFLLIYAGKAPAYITGLLFLMAIIIIGVSSD